MSASPLLRVAIARDKFANYEAAQRVIASLAADEDVGSIALGTKLHKHRTHLLPAEVQLHRMVTRDTPNSEALVRCVQLLLQLRKEDLAIAFFVWDACGLEIMFGALGVFCTVLGMPPGTDEPANAVAVITTPDFGRPTYYASLLALYVDLRAALDRAYATQQLVVSQ